VDVFLQKGQPTPRNNEGEVSYVDKGKSVTLMCFGKVDGDLGVELEWFKNNESLTPKCASEETYNDINRITGEEVKIRHCQTTASKEDEKVDGHWGRSISLRFNKVLPNDFGTYECKGNFSLKSNPTNQDHVVKRVYLWETITATRQNAQGKRQRNVLVYEEEELYIYCNFTGLRNDLFVSWYKDDKDITDDLQNGKGNFSCSITNETEISEGNNLCIRVANLNKHRGVYTCEVKKSYEFGNDKFKYPVRHTYMIRVKAVASILFPGVILIVECIILAIITMVTWKNTSSGEMLDGNDWEDDDENDVDENRERAEEEEELTSKPLTGG